MLRSALALALLGLVAVTPVLAADPEPPKVSYQNDRLTLHASDMPVSDLIEALKKETGAEIRGEAPDGKISATFDDVPLREALGRVLGDQSFTLTYADDGRLKAIQLKGGPTEKKGTLPEAAPPSPVVDQAPTAEAAAPRRGSRAPKPSGRPAKERVDGLAHVFDHRAPIKVDGKLAAASGESEVDWAWMLRTAGSHEQEDVRAEAFEKGVREIDQNAEMRKAMVDAMSDLSDQELAQFSRAMLGPNALGITKLAARLAHSRDFRGRLRDVARQLRVEERQQAANAR